MKNGKKAALAVVVVLVLLLVSVGPFPGPVVDIPNVQSSNTLFAACPAVASISSKPAGFPFRVNAYDACKSDGPFLPFVLLNVLVLGGVGYAVYRIVNTVRNKT